MKVGKPKSKRVPVRLRHKIEKASSAKQKKQRKEAKKNPQWRSRLKKDPGIPNLFPYKAKVLAEIEESKRRKEEEQQQKRELAKARREGKSVNGTSVALDAEASDDGDELDDIEDDADHLDQDTDEEMEDDGANPMAALLASAQARAQTFTKDGEHDDDSGDAEDDEDAWDGLQDGGATTQSAKAGKKTLPKQALADPLKGIALLMERMHKTQDGTNILIQHYQLPPLVTTGNDFPTRFLVEVARKRGRLGRGGIPNLHAAALIVLNDLNEEKLLLPPVVQVTKSAAAASDQVTIVKTMAAPFRIEGLWGDEAGDTASTEMAIET